MNRDNDLLRAAEQALANEKRLADWCERWYQVFGRMPPLSVHEIPFGLRRQAF